MQNNLRLEHPELSIEIIGINQRVEGNLGNEGMTAGRDLPWLQDVDEAINDQTVWEAWSVTERDVVILDENNHHVGRYNLTQNDLANPDNFAELENLLVSVAGLENEPSSLAGRVYFDVNQNGNYDPPETAIGNVKIQLTGTTDLGDSIEETVLTEADGTYRFLGLASGSYLIAQTQPAFVIDGQESLGTAGGTAREDQFEVVLAAGIDGQGYNFAELGRQAQAIHLSDFLASTADGGMIATVELETGNHWYCLDGGWEEYQYAQVDFQSETSHIDVHVRDTHGHDLSASFSTEQATNVVLLAENTTHKSLRIRGTLNDTSSNSLTTEPLTTDSSALIAEGEFVLLATLPPLGNNKSESLTESLIAASPTRETLFPTVLPAQKCPPDVAAQTENRSTVALSEATFPSSDSPTSNLDQETTAWQHDRTAVLDDILRDADLLDDLIHSRVPSAESLTQLEPTCHAEGQPVH